MKMSSALFIAVCFIVDFIYSSLFVVDPAMIQFVSIPAAALAGMLCLCRQTDWVHSLYLAFIVGLISDFVAAQPSMIFALIFILCMLIMKEWSRHLSNSLLEQLILLLSTIFIKETLVYLFLSAESSFTMGLSLWLERRCIPTLLGNIPLVLIVIGLYQVKVNFDARKERTKRREETLFWKEYK